MANNLLSTVKLIDEANVVLSKHSKLLSQAALDAEKLNKAYANLPSKFIKAQQTQLSNQTKLTASTKALNTQTNKITTSYKQAIPSLTALVNQRKKEQRLLERTSGLYNRVQAAINKVTKTYQDLALKKKLGGNLSKQEERQLTSLQGKLLKYNNALKQVDAQVGKNQRNVGNYASAMKGLAVTFRAVASAFGLTSGIFLFAQGIRDAFTRIREFDKAMQNISGVMRVSRSDIKDLEKEIISVAASSIKTSREVASLAENLVTLGKTKTEIKDLLKPVNDLAIGLETTSGEAAEFLVQTLNAFGAGSDEAAKYADTIATIRTSTSLDFQKMRDSFQYLAPISAILNKDLAYTGALIGVVADRGIKAEQAGRLLGTAQMKLASQNKTLMQGLEELNMLSSNAKTETEALSLATKMFGVNSAKVGVTLAGSIDKLAEYEDKIRNSSGALEDLTNEQLKSLDAQLKILDSTWEQFILNIEQGEGILAKVFGGLIKLTTATIMQWNLITNLKSKDEWETSKLYKSTLKLLKANKTSIDVAKDTIDLETKRLAQLKTSAKFGKLSKEQLEENNLEQLKTLGILKALREYEANYVAPKGGTGGDGDDGDDAKGRARIISVEEQTQAVEHLRKEIDRQIEQYKALLTLYPEGSEKAKEYTKKIKDLRIVLGEVSAIDVSGAMKEMGSLWTPPKYITSPPPETEDEWKDTFQTVTNVARQAFGIISELSAMAFAKQYADLEKQKETAILFAGESATARAEIERQYEEKKKAIQIKEAKAQKAQSIFEIAINTASAVVQALPNVPLSVIVGALGAAQLAMVAAQPIPAFWKGGEVGGSQQIMVNDDPYGKKGSNYKEVIEKPNGQILTPQGKNVKMRVPKGSFVHPTYDAFVNSLDSELLNNNIMPIGANSIMPMIINNGLTKGEVMDVMDNHASRLVSTINGQHGVNISIDENGINKYIKKKGGTSKIMNARYSGNGIGV